ncbi:hypothetical protein [Paenibacillus sp. J2TS4]|uniref:hypothetical protein n=1 Tax=Paenibacillus sp. J2TS4 TaxID=2807194 RepID=UPI001B057690|nr:hypothetical protein [Paenibacillus sp. J2TS4]GIP32728.1 hypothetical protein J2TS4_19380 [Paenibacillus sp. J2TS4]
MISNWNNNVLDSIKIGVIGSEVVVKKISKVLKGFPSFQPIYSEFTNENEVPALAQELMDEVEVLLFSGPLPYQRAKDKLKFTVPVHYLPLTGTGLYRALFRSHKRFAASTLSVDTLKMQMIEPPLNELGEVGFETVVYNGKDPYSKEELIRFHRKIYEESDGKACALTGLKSVADELTALKIPNEWVVPTEQDIIVTLERALLSTETRRSKESQIVLGLIVIDDSGKLYATKATEHEVQKLKLDVHRMLLGYVESLDGHLTHLGGDEYLFITTRGIFERETGGYKYIPLAHEAEKSFGFTLSMGVGFGQSAGEAGTHARIALRQAREAGGNISFIVREDRSVIGPLEMSQPLEVNLSLIDSNLIKKAENSGMTLAYLSKLAAQVARKGQTDYTAKELAAILGVTIRSVHRFLLQWTDNGLVDIVGEQRNPSKGRPKQIYRLLFIDNQQENEP